MCAVSAVADQWGREYPGLLGTYKDLPFQPGVIAPNTAADMLMVLQKLEEIDRKLGAIECKLKESEKETMKRRLAEIAEGL